MEKKWVLGNRKDSILNRQYFENESPCVSIFCFFERTILERERRRRMKGGRKRERGRQKDIYTETKTERGR